MFNIKSISEDNALKKFIDYFPENKILIDDIGHYIIPDIPKGFVPARSFLDMFDISSNYHGHIDYSKEPLIILTKNNKNILISIHSVDTNDMKLLINNGMIKILWK